MNPFPFVRAALARNPLTALVFMVLVAITVALGSAISMQERALRQGSARAADGFDLIVAAPGSQTDILLASVFLRPSAVELIAPAQAHAILTDRDAAFAAPLAFGDSHRGSQVVGTTAEFVAHLGSDLAEGRPFTSLEEAVVGALVEAKIGARLEIRHGHADDLTGGQDADAYEADEDHHHAHDDDHDHEHDDDHDHAHEDDAHSDHGTQHLHDDVIVTGRMAPTGTPWDRAVIVPVEYVWMAHALGTGHALGDARIGAPWQAELLPPLPAIVVKPKSIAGAYGLRARYRTTETMAFFPAETLVELYGVMGGATRIMTGLTLAAQGLVMVAILAGLLAVLDLQRQRFAVLRAMGAPAGFVFLVVWLYVAAMLLLGTLLGPLLGWGLASALSSQIGAVTGVALLPALSWREIGLAAALLVVSGVLALIPAWRLYRQPVAEALRQG